MADEMDWLDEEKEDEGPIVKPKVVLLGDRTVGKTTMLNPYLIDPMTEDQLKTFGFKVAKRVEKKLKRGDGDEVDSYLMLFEVDGDQMEDMTHDRLSLAMGGSQGVVVMVDSLRLSTLDELLFQLDKYFEINKDDRPIVLVANKVDVLDIVKARIRGHSVVDQIREELRASTNPLLRSEKALKTYVDGLHKSLDQVDPEGLLFRKNLEQIAQDVANRFGPTPHIFISAATGKNVDKVFRRVAKLTLPDVFRHVAKLTMPDDDGEEYSEEEPEAA